MFFDRYRKETLLSTCRYLIDAALRKQAVYGANGFSVVLIWIANFMRIPCENTFALCQLLDQSFGCRNSKKKSHPIIKKREDIVLLSRRLMF